MIVVSNTSPIIALAQVEQMGLLEQLYGAITIPMGVYAEATVGGPGRHWASTVQSADWIKTRHVSNQEAVMAFRNSLGRGEAEAIILTSEISADLLLIDEALGRKEALNRSLTHTGVLGVLIQAKGAKLLQEVKPVLDDLAFGVGFRVSQRLYRQVLQSVGE